MEVKGYMAFYLFVCLLHVPKRLRKLEALAPQMKYYQFFGKSLRKQNEAIFVCTMHSEFLRHGYCLALCPFFSFCLLA